MNKSVITSMYNKKAGVLEVIDKLFLPSLVNNASPDTELIILDDCSPLEKETKELVSKYMPDLKKFGNVVFERNQKNLGFGGSFNRGMKMASGKKLLLVNDDVYLPKESVSSLIGTLDESPTIALAGPIVNEPYVYTAQYLKQSPRLNAYSQNEFNKIEDFAKKMKSVFNGVRIKADWVCGFCMAGDADKIREFGWFDEQFKHGTCEDSDLGTRMSEKYSIVINPEIFVYHGGVDGCHASLKQEPLKTAYYCVANAIKNSIKRGNIFEALTANMEGNKKGRSGKGTVSEMYDKIMRAESPIIKYEI